MRAPTAKRGPISASSFATSSRTSRSTTLSARSTCRSGSTRGSPCTPRTRTRTRGSRSLTGASLSKSLIPLDDLDRAFPADHVRGERRLRGVGRLRAVPPPPGRPRALRVADRSHAQGGRSSTARSRDAYGTDARRLEYEWREELAKRYTFWPVLLSGSVVWVVVLGLLAVGLVRKKRRDRLTLARWEREEREEAEEAARRAAITAAIQSEPAPPPERASHRGEHPQDRARGGLAHAALRCRPPSRVRQWADFARAG